ncbi:disulfide bond formation protein B [Ignatzschineria rhizosphaerae]|uniref:Disulfide bond formation protein B n=2 Tax=Ignatzschineria rhizosphaerae TaxID=2923279 RepID=A0ABY3X8P4_9GAMM|nr:disulfide bond formation protein B [Ignatzschineria rhizosphaerae]UNM97125.1 disulfide bond formation protein B [Ignatzschineria rhizosphaerae]
MTFMNTKDYKDKDSILTWLLYFYMLGMMAVIAAILTAAMTLQYANGELPCPLCLLQRAAMFGVCFGIMQQFKHGYSYRNTGISLIFSLLLLIISVRQTLLDIYPRPGHEYIGSAVFGIHMPVWSIFIATCLILALALQLLIWGSETQWQEKTVTKFPVLKILATILSIYVIVIGSINFISVGVQCKFNECHTFSYQLLDHK